jgi:rubrerythrin
MFTTGEIVDLAIQIEKNGERIYRDALQKAPNSSLAAGLERLADEEAQHAKWFSEIKEDAQTSIDDPRVEEMGKSILRGILGDQVFSLQDVDFSSLEKVKDLFEQAIEFEKDTVLFYEMIRNFIEDEGTSSDLNKIIEEEERHIQLIRGFFETGKATNNPKC